MKIYVVECVEDYLVQVGWCISLEVANEWAKEMSDVCGNHYWVTEYELNKKGRCWFE